MTILRMVRFVAWLLMLGAVFAGVAALFSGEWATVALCVVAFFGIGLIFSYANAGTERLARNLAVEDADDIAYLVAAGDWHGALRASNRAVEGLSKSVRAVGKSSENRGPLGGMLVLQSALLGLTGDLDGSTFASRRAVSLLEGLESPSPLAVALMQQGRELQARAHDQAYCARTALETADALTS